MKNNLKGKKVIRLTEADLEKIVKRVIAESEAAEAEVEKPEVELEEGAVGDFFKKTIGQLKVWVLDGSFLTKASQDVIEKANNHPAYKNLIPQLQKKFGMDENQAKELVLRILDWGGKPDWKTAKFDPATKKFSLEPPKGTTNPNPGG